MVSESEFDKNQQAFRASMQTAGPSPGTAGPSPGTAPTAGQILQNPSLAPYAGTTSDIDPTGEYGQMLMETIAIGGLTAGIGSAIGGVAGTSGSMLGKAGTGGSIGPKALTMLKGRGVGVMLAPIIAFFAGASGIANSIIGKEWNKFSSDNNLSTGNLKLAAFEQMYTTPIEVGGKWVFLFEDETKLAERMREAGVDAEQIPGRVQQLNQVRQANIELINYVGQPSEFASQQIPGETALKTAERLSGEKTKEKEALLKQQEEQLAYETKPVNAMGKTQKQIDETNAAFSEGAMQSYEAEQKPRILTGPKRNVAQGKELGKPEASVTPSETPPATPPSGPFTPRYRTKAELEAAMGASLTEAAWRRYLLTGAI